MTENKLKLKGIDISEFNGFIDFEKLKDEVDFVIIRATFGRYGVDKLFKRNVEQAIKYNIPFGLYYYSYAINEEQGKEETNFFIKTTSEYFDKVSFPCFIDMEDSDGYKKNHGNPTGEILTNICVNACKELSNYKVFVGVYANKNYFDKILDKEKLKGFSKWLAWWNDEAETLINKEDYTMLQFSNKGKLKSIKGDADVNYSFVDYKRTKEYINYIAKVQAIKLQSGLEDLTMQFLSCYKYGSDLINKIADRLEKPKMKRERLSNDELKKTIRKEFNLETKTISFLSFYIYGDFLFEKLYNAITESDN